MRVLIPIFFIFFSISSQAQYYADISKEHYDSLDNLWHPGRVFLMNGDFKDGLIHREPLQPYIKYKADTLADTLILTSYKVQGFYLISKEDTAIFVFQNTNKKGGLQNMLALFIVMDASHKKNGISLLCNHWLEKTEYEKNVFWNKPKYQILWTFYFKKKEVIYEFNDSSVLKELISNSKDARDFYNKNKSDLNREDTYYKFILDILKIYNETI